MADRLHLAAGRALYAAATKQRMARAIGELSAILQADAGDMQWVLRHVREQEKASRLAGFHLISRRCREMAECADDARRADRTWLLAVAQTLLDTCRAIHVHADGIAKCAAHGATAQVRRSRNGTGSGGQAAEDVAEPANAARWPPRQGPHVHWRLTGQAASPRKEALSATDANVHQF